MSMDNNNNNVKESSSNLGFPECDCTQCFTLHDEDRGIWRAKQKSDQDGCPKLQFLFEAFR